MAVGGAGEKLLVFQLALRENGKVSAYIIIISFVSAKVKVRNTKLYKLDQQIGVNFTPKDVKMQWYFLNSKKQASTLFANAFITSSSSQLLFVPHHNLSFSSRAFRVSAAKVCNTPPLHIAIHNHCPLSAFRRHLKTHYFQLAHPAT